MPGLVCFFISCFMGYLILRCFKRRDFDFDLMDACLAIGLGAGASAQIVFYSLLLLDHIDPLFIIAVHLLILCLLWFYVRRFLPGQRIGCACPWRQVMAVAVVLALATWIAAIMAAHKPWGDWDGWAYWDFHAGFLFKAGYGWRRIFGFNIQAPHPWMLPLLMTWGWSFYGALKETVPQAIGIIFTVATAGLLMAALKKHVSFGLALLAGIFLVSIPYFTEHGTSQYSDIEMAFFILLSCVLAVDLLKEPSVSTAALIGLSLGFMACLKDNGIAAALILMAFLVRRLSQKGMAVFIRPLGWGFAAIAVSVLLMRSFEGANTYTDSYKVLWTGLVSGYKWGLIAQFAFYTLFNINWGGLWLLALVIFALRRAKEGMDFLIQFVLFYVILYFFIFAASALPLPWLLDVSFDRMLYLLAPTVIFTIFYAV